jgi:Spy/CpxP family protein refolding chaperone
MRRKLFIVTAALAAPLLIAGTVYAGRGYFHNPERWKSRFMDHLEEATEDKAPLSEQQEAAVEALFDRTAQGFLAKRDQRWGMADRALGLFAAPSIDESAVEALKRDHRAQADITSEQMLGAVRELHDILTPVQRQAVADYARDMKARYGGDCTGH